MTITHALFGLLKEMTMLDLSQVDLGGIVIALKDRSGYGRWWIDGLTGEVWWYRSDEDDSPEFDPDERDDARWIEPLSSRVAYGDMQDFIALVPDRRAADLLDRAIDGRGAFRRFKDMLFDFPELREQWFAFHDVRMRRRAIEYLVDEALVSPVVAACARAELVEPTVGGDRPAGDAWAVAAAVASELCTLYGQRLVEVVLYGSHARGDASAESDIDLAVILDEIASPWHELRLMDHILWRHTLESGLTVSALPIDRARWTPGDRPFDEGSEG